MAVSPLFPWSARCGLTIQINQNRRQKDGRGVYEELVRTARCGIPQMDHRVKSEKQGAGLRCPSRGPCQKAAHFETSTPKDEAAARRVTRKRKYFFGSLTAKARKILGPGP